MCKNARSEQLAKARATYSAKVSSQAAAVVSYYDSLYPCVSVKGIAAHFGISSWRVYRYLKSAGRSLPPRRQNPLIDKVISYFDERYPNIKVSEIAMHFGISERTVRRYLKGSGRQLPPQQRKQMDMEKVKQAHALYASLNNKAAVARAMGCSAMQVSRYLKIPIEKVGS